MPGRQGQYGAVGAVGLPGPYGDQGPAGISIAGPDGFKGYPGNIFWNSYSILNKNKENGDFCKYQNIKEGSNLFEIIGQVFSD